MAKRSPSAKYRQVACRVWDVMRMRGYSDAKRVAWLYLLTGPESHFSGLYSLGIASMGETLCRKRIAVRAQLADFEAEGRIKFDERARLVLVNRWLKWKPLENPNQAISAAVHVKSLPDSPLKAAWLAAARQYLKDDLYAIVERTLKGTVPPTVPEGSGKGLGKGSGKGLGEQEVRSKDKDRDLREGNGSPKKAAVGGLLDAPPAPTGRVKFPAEPKPDRGPIDQTNESHLAWLSVAVNLGMDATQIKTIDQLTTAARLTAFATRNASGG